MFHKTGYKFTNKKNPQQGIMASILGAIAMISVGFAIYLTYLNKGIAPMQYGTVILLSLIFAIVGLVLGIRACMEKDIYKVFPILGILLNSMTILAGGFILYLGI